MVPDAALRSTADNLAALRLDPAHMSWEAPVRFCVLVAVAALALTGCNANQGVNLSSRTAPGVVAGPDYNPYNPISYAQNNTGIGGGGGK